MFRSARKAIFGLALGPLLALIVRADEIPTPHGAPPSFVQISKLDRTRNSIMVLVPVVEQVSEVYSTPSGKTATRMIPVTKWISAEWKLSTLRMLDGEGKEVVGEKAWNRLEAGKMVLRSNSNPFDPAWVKGLGREAVIFVPKTDGKD